MSPEFPNDNPELWMDRCPALQDAIGDEAFEADVEVVEFHDADFATAEVLSVPPPPEDTFQVFVRALIEVALHAGASAAVVALIPAMLGQARLDVHSIDEATEDRLVKARLIARTDAGAIVRNDALVTTASAWRAAMLGEPTVLSVSTTLDEWAAHLVVALLGMPEQKEALRRELRVRGIAAFGMLVDAA